MKKRNSVLLEVFDTLFIMMLCFGTLLTAMIAKGSGASEIDYSIDIRSFMITVVCIGAYFIFVLTHSEKGLKKLISHRYKVYK